MANRSLVVIALAGAALGTLVGCSGSGPQLHAKSGGYDVIVARDSHGRGLMVVPSTGIMLRDGAKESVDVQVEWTLAQDVGRGRMLVYSADGSRLLANVNAGDVDVMHKGGNVSGFVAEMRGAQVASR